MTTYADLMHAEAVRRKAQARARADEYRADKAASRGDVGYPGQGDTTPPAPQIPVSYAHLAPQSADEALRDSLEDRYGYGQYRIEGGRVIARNFSEGTWDWRDVGATADFCRGSTHDDD